MSDQYTAAAAASPSLSQKLSDLRTFLGSQHTVVLVTHAPDGALHGRVMAISKITPDWKIQFIYDKDSYKDTEVENDLNVNISADGTLQNKGWVSIAGKAKRNSSPDAVKELYTPTLKAWFGDKGDGVHDGSPTDPRMAVLEVRIDEIRHFHQQRTVIGTVVDVVSSAISGETATPGEVRTITGQEIASAWAQGQLTEP